MFSVATPDWEEPLSQQYRKLAYPKRTSAGGQRFFFSFLFSDSGQTTTNHISPQFSIPDSLIDTMAKDRAEKKEKREKKDKRSEKDGVKKEKKEKKEKKDKTALTNAVEQELTSKVLDGIDQAEKTNGDIEAEVEQMEVDGARPVGALVPFANPLVEDKSAKKVLKSVKKGKF